VRLSISQKSGLGKAAKHYAQSVGLAQEYLAARGLSSEIARRAGLGVVHDPHTGHDQMSGRLSIPYITTTGVVDIRFRSLDGSDPKYLGLPGARTHMFNVRAVSEADDYIAVCEGELDAITLHFAVGIPAVGIPGASNWKTHYRRLLQDFEKVFVFADGDKAGNDFARHLAREVQGVVIINMPEGEDVNSMYLKEGSNYFMEKVKYE
jgi:DNA primase